MAERNGGAIDPESFQFMVPERGVMRPEDMTKWQDSEAYGELIGFIIAMNEAVKNRKLRDEIHVPEQVESVLGILDTLDKWIDEIPPIEQPQRFGNKAFRTFFTRLEKDAESLIKEALDDKLHNAVPEIGMYLIQGVGNSTRIDYGTGHELSFTAFLCCLFKVGHFQPEHSLAVVFKVFNRYLEVMRKLHTTYRMEPAGTHGVWSLDDYHFIPFIWGSSQLLDHKRILPKSFPDPMICVSFAEDYMFLACISYIHQMKTGPFAEHSNQLWNISGVAAWSKVNSGLIKMYKAEVLAKFPVIQHFLFGNLLSIKPVVR